MRATPRSDRMGRSPFELVAGLKPHGAKSFYFRKFGGKTISPTGYVATLQEYLAHVHGLIREQLAGELGKKRHASAFSGTKRKTTFSVGDHVLLRKPPLMLAKEVGSEGTSKRLLPLTSGVVYEVYKVVSESHVILCDVDTRSTELGFAQPIASERLVEYDLRDLEVPIDLHEPLCLELKRSAAAEFKRGFIESQSATGLVLIDFRDGSEPEWFDLALFEHRWVTPGLAAPEAVLISGSAPSSLRSGVYGASAQRACATSTTTSAATTATSPPRL